MGGMGLPCGLLNTIITIVKLVAAMGVFYALPKLQAKMSVLSTYRQISVAFPGTVSYTHLTLPTKRIV